MIAPSLAERYVASMDTQPKAKLVAIVDDDELMRSALQGMLKSVGLPSRAFASAEEFLKSGQQKHTACLITDIRMPGMSGLELQAKPLDDGVLLENLRATLENEPETGGYASGGSP